MNYLGLDGALHKLPPPIPYDRVPIGALFTYSLDDKEVGDVFHKLGPGTEDVVAINNPGPKGSRTCLYIHEWYLYP